MHPRPGLNVASREAELPLQVTPIQSICTGSAWRIRDRPLQLDTITVLPERLPIKKTIVPSYILMATSALGEDWATIGT